MNRRNFFKVITGFIAGVFATSAVAKEKPKLTVAMLQKVKNELDARKISDDFFIPVNEYQWHKHKDCEWHCKHKDFQKALNKVVKDKLSLFTYRGYLFTTRPFLWDSVLSLEIDSDPTHELMITLPFKDLLNRNILCESRIRQWKEPNIKIATNKHKATYCRNQKNCVLCDFNSSSNDDCLIDNYKIYV